MSQIMMLTPTDLNSDYNSANSFPPNFISQTYNSVANIGDAAWDALSAGKPFQSAHWYQYGERVMDACTPVYVILSLNGQPVARGTFWLVCEEPLNVQYLTMEDWRSK